MKLRKKRVKVKGNIKAMQLYGELHMARISDLVHNGSRRSMNMQHDNRLQA